MQYTLRDILNKQAIPFFLVASLFFIPISPSLKSIFVVLSLISILFAAKKTSDFSWVLSQSWTKAGLAFFIIALLACTWSAASVQMQLVYVEKYSKLLFLPILALGFRNRILRMLGIHAFLLAMLITCELSIIKDINYPDGFPIYDPAKIFHNHIITSFMMAFAAYLSGLFLIQLYTSENLDTLTPLKNSESAKKFFVIRLSFQRLAYFFLVTIFSYQILFVSTGRAGYVLYFILMTFLLFQSLPRRYKAIGLFCFIAIFSLLSYQSRVVSDGFVKVAQEWNNYKQGQHNSRIGERVRFHIYAKKLFLSSPLIGYGTGGYAQAVQHDDFIPLIRRLKLMDPHSQYWLVASDAGILGLSALFCFFLSLVLNAFRLREMKPIMLGMLLAFFIGNLSDSLLLYSAVGYLFIFFSALCLGELVEKQMHEVPVEEPGLSFSEKYRTA